MQVWPCDSKVCGYCVLWGMGDYLLFYSAPQDFVVCGVCVCFFLCASPPREASSSFKEKTLLWFCVKKSPNTKSQHRFFVHHIGRRS